MGRDEAAERALAELGAALSEAVRAAVGPWVTSSVLRVLEAWRAAGGAVSDEAWREAMDGALRAAEAATAEVGDSLATVLAADVDAQGRTPLEIVRQVVRYPTAVLRDAGVGAVERDRFVEQRLPDDLYDLTPRSLAVLAPGLVALASAWGAAKAAAHRARHGASPSR
ncbi:MAG: hypothetical protein ACYDD4_06820 [Acidimicrobiales bacterium]